MTDPNPHSGLEENDDTIAQIGGLSFTVTRTKMPLYTMGDVNPESFSRGPRGIAGSTIFLTMNGTTPQDYWADAEDFMEWDNDEDHTSR